MKEENKKRLYALLSRKFFLAVGINIAIITIITILFSITLSYSYENGVIVGRISMLSESGFVKIIQALLVFNGTYLGVNMLQKFGQVISTKLNGNSKDQNTDKTESQPKESKESPQEEDDDDI